MKYTGNGNMKSRLMAGGSIAATVLGLLFVSTSAFAQDASTKPAAPPAAKPSSADADTVVVVRARGRVEQLQTVPISDSAFSSKQLTDAHVREVADFINLTPNITIVQAQNAGYNAISIRGITQVRNSESPVAVVVDGVQEVNSYQFTQELFDLQSIEVLRGPQGALYGRDAEGGAILITTKQPDDYFTGHIQGGIGSGGETSAQGVISGPLVKDVLFGRLGVSYVNRDGYFDNIYLNKKQDPFRDSTEQGLLKWVPTDKFSADLRLNYSKTDGGALNYHFQGAGLLPNGLINPADPVSFTVPGNANQVSDVYNSRDIGVDQRTISEASLNMSYDLGSATLRSVTAWNHVVEFYSGDGYPYGNTDTLQLIPGTNLFDVDASATQYLDVDATSEELRLTSNGNTRFRWMFGGYYLATDRYISTTTGLNNGEGILEVHRTPAGMTSINPTLSFLGDENHNIATALFANFDYDLTDALQVSAAFRYDQDKRTQYVSQYNTSGVPGAVNSATFGHGEPKLSATYKVSPDLSVYGSWGVGFRSGEFNQNGAGAAAAAAGTPGIVDKVPQEVATTSEIGLKGSAFSGIVHYTGDLYNTDVTNQQYFVFVGAIAAQVLVPIDKVRLQGGEFEATANLAPGLTLSGSVGVTDSKIKAYRVDPADVGNKAPYVPDMTANLAIQYRHSIGGSLNLVTRASYRLLGKQYWDTENSTARNDVNLVGLSIGIENPEQKWTASIDADNVFDVKYNAEYVAGGYVEPANPAVIRATIRKDF